MYTYLISLNLSKKHTIEHLLFQTPNSLNLFVRILLIVVGVKCFCEYCHLMRMHTSHCEPKVRKKLCIFLLSNSCLSIRGLFAFDNESAKFMYIYLYFRSSYHTNISNMKYKMLYKHTQVVHAINYYYQLLSEKVARRA